MYLLLGLDNTISSLIKVWIWVGKLVDEHPSKSWFLRNVVLHLQVNVACSV